MSLMIETRGLTRMFDSAVAVEDLNIEVEKGEILGCLGPNGAGKTTTVRMLSGIISPTRGYAVVAGIRTDQEVERLHEAIGLLTETAGFYERLNARRNLQFFAQFYPSIDVNAQVDKHLQAVGLWERRDQKVASFSKGLKQRLALARALVHEPPVLLLDEPTAGLDPEAASEVRDLIRRLREEDRTILLCTHNLEEAELLCDRIAVLNTRLVALDTPVNLRNRLFRRQVIVQMESIDDGITSAVRDLGFIESVNPEGSNLIVELRDFDRNRPALVECIVRAGGKIHSVYEKSHSLEEIYLTLLHQTEERTIK